MRERIERYLQQRTEMLAGVSHDLKTPLTRIEAATGDDVLPGADVNAMRNDVVEMERMLDEYLQFARGEGSEQMQLVDLGGLVRDATQAAARARGAGAERVAIDTSQAITLSLRRLAMRRCVTNLIDNALKLRQSRLGPARARRGGLCRSAWTTTGPGIPEARREEAFRPFHRLDEGRNLQAGGVGLGLAIARDITRAHGGDLFLDTSPQGGLRAVVRLPV